MSDYERHLTLENLIEEYGLSAKNGFKDEAERERAELLRRFAALEAERDEAVRLIEVCHRELKEDIELRVRRGKYKPEWIEEILTLTSAFLARTAQPPTAKEHTDA